MAEVHTELLLKDLWEQIRVSVGQQLDGMLAAEADTAQSDRIDAEILWNALEKCKQPLANHFGCQAKDLFCRAEPVKDTSWASMAPDVYGWSNRHDGDPTKDPWLVVGIPSYPTWERYAGRRGQTPRQIYTIHCVDKMVRLKSLEGWWPL